MAQTQHMQLRMILFRQRAALDDGLVVAKVHRHECSGRATLRRCLCMTTNVVKNGGIVLRGADVVYVLIVLAWRWSLHR